MQFLVTMLDDAGLEQHRRHRRPVQHDKIVVPVHGILLVGPRMLRIVVARRHEAGETHGGADRGGAAAARRRFRVAPRNVQREAGVLVAVAQALTFPDPGFLFVGRQGIMVQRQEQVAAACRVGAGRQRGDPAIVVDRSHRDPARGQCRLHDRCQGPVEVVFTAATGTDRARVRERVADVERNFGGRGRQRERQRRSR